MQEKSLIKKNILQYIEYKGVSQYNFYKTTGITRGILTQNNGISEENITRFIAYFPEVNIEWLLTGKGEMLKNEEPSKTFVKHNKEKHIEELINTQKDLIENQKKYIEKIEQELKQIKSEKRSTSKNI